MDHQRRDLLKKAAIGGAVAWTAPVVLSGVAAAGGGSTVPCGFADVTLDGSCQTSLLTATYTLTPGCGQVVVQIDYLDQTFCPVTSGVGVSSFLVGGTATVTVRSECGAGGTVFDTFTSEVPDCTS